MLETLPKPSDYLGETGMDNGVNQQATPTEGEIAWLAGIIEGEGTLMMSLWKRNDGPDRRPKVGLQIKIYNSDAGLIRKAASILELLAVGFHLKEREMPPMTKPGGEGEYAPTAPMLTLTVSRLSAVDRVLKAIRPWLFGDKSARADLMLQFLDRRFAKFEDDSMGKRAPYDAGDIRLVLAFIKNGKRGDVKVVERVLNELEQCAA
jgi:hypothetical protein